VDFVGNQKEEMNTLKQLFLSSRPLSWVNTAFPFAAAYFFTTGRIDTVFVVGTLFFLIPYNLAMYGINDVFDYESDLRNPRKGGVEGAVLDRSLHKITLWAVVITNSPFLIYLISIGDLEANITLAISMFAVVAYSIKGLRFKEIPVVDSITSSTHFVSPAVYGVILAGATFTPSLWLILTAFFLWGMASHAFGAIQDIQADREAQLSSIATVFGAANTARFALGCYALAGVLILSGALVTQPEWRYWVASVTAIPYVLMVWPFRNLSDDRCEQANRGWKWFLTINFFAGAVVCLLLINYVQSR
jgi:4-hydroxybenzoate polyprenyltransferase